MSQHVAAMEHMRIAKPVAAQMNSHGDIRQMINRIR